MVRTPSYASRGGRPGEASPTVSRAREMETGSQLGGLMTPLPPESPSEGPRPSYLPPSGPAWHPHSGLAGLGQSKVLNQSRTVKAQTQSHISSWASFWALGPVESQPSTCPRPSSGHNLLRAAVGLLPPRWRALARFQLWPQRGRPRWLHYSSRAGPWATMAVARETTSPPQVLGSSPTSGSLLSGDSVSPSPSTPLLVCHHPSLELYHPTLKLGTKFICPFSTPC